MKYNRFSINNYRAIDEEIIVDLQKSPIIPLVGINECGKTTILQGIFCFDYLNDRENAGKHLQNILNLYKTTNQTPIIKANINLSWSDIEFMVNTYNTTLDGIDERRRNENKITQIENPFQKSKFIGNITIIRNLYTKLYSFESFIPNEKINQYCIHELILKYIHHLPYILYNDDFNDRPQTIIEIPDKNPGTLSGWLAIYERLFNKVSPDYSLFTLISETDERRKKSIIADVQEHLNNNLSKAWRTFSADHKGNISINLELRDNNTSKKKELVVGIIEKITNKDRYFNILDRSKGFIWYFNFIMKVQYNPKIAGSAKSTIFLLDEPGSYLHAKAQEKLCIKLSEISREYGNVIYCTHSHHLLNPDYIPPNCIHIVEKDKNKSINLIPLNIFHTNNEKNDAIQPVYEALQLPNYEVIQNVDKIIVVEGIYDKYVIEIFCDLAKNTRIMPSTSADSIVKNLQYLITFGKKYIAIWDNDDEGRRCLEKAKNIFGPIEANKFDFLPSNGKQKRRMEQMFCDEDIKCFIEMLNLNSNANYESIVSGLYYSDRVIRKKAKSKINEDTKKCFLILEGIIHKRFENYLSKDH